MFIESENLELKRDITDTLCKEIISFANSKGGTIYIGYDDKSNLVGVVNAKEKLDKISNMISDVIEPNITFNVSLEIKREEKKDIIVIKVLKGTNRPYYIKKYGMTEKGVFLRLGATNKPATREEIRQMIMEDNSITFETNVSINQNLTFEELNKEFDSQNITLNETKMKNLGLLSESNQYTNLAYIVSDQNPFQIKIAVYKDNNKVEFLDRKEFEKCSVFKQLHDVEDYLKMNNKIGGKIVGLKRKDSVEYDYETIRESLLNSIIHKNYDIQGAIIINIFEDSLQIVNLGGLVSGLTIEDIKNGSSSTRNPKLASIFHRLNYIESYGSGIPRIYEKYKEQDNQPIIDIGPNSFVITLPKIKINEEIVRVLDYIEKYGQISREDIENLFNCSKTTAIRILNKFVERKILKRVNNGKSTYYVLE